MATPRLRLAAKQSLAAWGASHARPTDDALTLTFKQSEVSDVLKSMTILDLNGGHIASVSYDSTKPLEQLLAEVALSIPDQGSLVGLLPQIKGARVAINPSGRSLGM